MSHLKTYLGTGGRSHGEREQLGGVGASFELDVGESRGVTLDRLGNASLYRVQLHCSLDLERVLSWLSGGWVGGDTDKDEPLAVRRDSIVDDLVGIQRGMSVKDLDVSVVRTTRLTLVGAACPSMTFQ